MRPSTRRNWYRDRQREDTIALGTQGVKRRLAVPASGGVEQPSTPPPGCGSPCGAAGVLPWSDAEAIFDAYRAQVTRWVDETIFTMGLPHIDHLGRRLRKGIDDAYAEEAAWGVRRQLRDPKTKLIPAIVLSVQEEFFDVVRAGRACLFHLRGLMYTITRRISWKMATKRALELMRERLAWPGEILEETSSSSSSPEDAVLLAERRLIERETVEAISRHISRLSPIKVAVFHARTEDPPRSYKDIGAELGITPGAARKHFCEARAYLLRVLKPNP